MSANGSVSSSSSSSSGSYILIEKESLFHRIPELREFNPDKQYSWHCGYITDCTDNDLVDCFRFSYVFCGGSLTHEIYSKTFSEFKEKVTQWLNERLI